MDEGTPAVNISFIRVSLIKDRVRGLVVRVRGYRSRGPGSIPSAASFSEKSGMGSTQPR
jgi:hypothetical protein